MEGNQDKRSLASPPQSARQNLPYTITGNFSHIKYQLGTFKSVDCVGGKLMYCTSKITGNGPHKDANFVRVKNLAEADKILRTKSLINSPRVMKPMTVVEPKVQPLMYYKSFDGCLSENDILEDLISSPSLNPILGNPNTTLTCAIKELTDAVIEMQSKGFSSTWLGLPIGYVRCSSTGLIKILLGEILVVDTEESKKMMNKEFMFVIENYFLKTSSPWPERDSFLECFKIENITPQFHLEMIRDHPFFT